MTTNPVAVAAAAVAVGALRWGDPVLDSAITSVEDGLRYRGQEVRALLADGVPFEQTAELLWEASPGEWPELEGPVAPPGPPLWRMIGALPGLALADTPRHGGTAEVEHQRARRLVSSLAAAASGASAAAAAANTARAAPSAPRRTNGATPIRTPAAR